MFRGFVELISARSLWLGELKENRPELWPGFFRVDLTPSIQNFLRRDDGGCCEFTESMEGVDCLLCIAHAWFSLVLPLLLALEGSSFMEHAKGQVSKYATTGEFVAQFSMPVDGPTQFVFGVSVVVILFCLQGLRASQSEALEGELSLATA